MNEIKITIAKKAPTFKKNLGFVIAVQEVSKSIRLTKCTVDVSSLSKHDLGSLGASAKFENVSRVAAPNGAIFALIGVGSEKLTQSSAREIGGAISRNLASLEELVIDLGSLSKTVALSLIEGLSIGHYDYNGFKSKANQKVVLLSKIGCGHGFKSNTEAREIRVQTKRLQETPGPGW
jgi:hypothetical protein